MAVVAFVLVLLLVAAGALVFALRRRRGVREYQELLRQGFAWRQVPPNDRLWRQVSVLRQFAGAGGLRDQFHMAGEHRGLQFEAVQYRRPPGDAGVAVFVPRPVPGPMLQLARTGQRSGQAVPTGHAEFDRDFAVTSSDAEFPRAALRTELLDELLRDERTRGCVVEFSPEHLVVFAAEAATVGTVLPMLDLLVDVHGRVPWEALA